MSSTLTFTEAVAFLKCTPKYLSDQIEAGKVQFTFNGRGKYLLSIKSLRRLNKGTLIPERTKKESPKAATPQTKAYRLHECIMEAKLAGMSLEEYKEVVLEESNLRPIIESSCK